MSISPDDVVRDAQEFNDFIARVLDEYFVKPVDSSYPNKETT